MTIYLKLSVIGSISYFHSLSFKVPRVTVFYPKLIDESLGLIFLKVLVAEVRPCRPTTPRSVLQGPPTSNDHSLQIPLRNHTSCPRTPLSSVNRTEHTLLFLSSLRFYILLGISLSLHPKSM